MASPDTPLRGVVVWPEQETMETTVTLYKVRREGEREGKGDKGGREKMEGGREER